MGHVFLKLFIFIFFASPLFAYATSEKLVFAVIGDAGWWNSNTQLVRDSIHHHGVQHLVLPGDNLYGFLARLHLGDYDDAWKPWKGFGLQFSVVALGNHNSGYENEIHYFELPGQFYSKSFKPAARFLVLNSDNQENALEQASWLHEQIIKAKEPCLFLVFHHPPVTLIRKHKWTEKKIFHHHIRPVLFANKNRISAMFLGHNHNAQALEINEIPAFLSGATHEIYAASNVNEVQDGIQIQTQYAYKGRNPHWLKLIIDPEKQTATYTYVDAKTNLPSFVTVRKCRKP